MSRNLFETVPARTLGRRQVQKRTGPVTLAELEHARAFIARMIIRHRGNPISRGEEAMPIFARLDAECEALRRNDDVLARVRAIAEEVG